MKEKLLSFFIGILIGIILSTSYHYFFKPKTNSFGGGRGSGMFRDRGDFGSGSMREYSGSGRIRGDSASGSIRSNSENGQN